MIGFGQKPCKKRKCKKCEVSSHAYVVSWLGRSLPGLLNNKVIYLPEFIFSFNKKVTQVEYYLKNTVTNQTTPIQTFRNDDKTTSIRIPVSKIESDMEGIFNPKDYTQGPESILKLYFRGYCYNNKYYSEWFVEELTLLDYTLSNHSDIGRILRLNLECRGFCFGNPLYPNYNSEYPGVCFGISEDCPKLEIYNTDFDVWSYYDSTSSKTNHITYTIVPEIDYTAIATIESKCKQPDILLLLKHLGLDVIIEKEIRRTPIHTTPIRTTSTYTTPVTYKTIGNTTYKQGGQTYGGKTYGGQTYGGEDYDWYKYTLIKKKESKEEKTEESSKYDILLKLSNLKDKGIISEEEFQKEKKKILNKE